jgi:hypothetical protein
MHCVWRESCSSQKQETCLGVIFRYCCLCIKLNVEKLLKCQHIFSSFLINCHHMPCPNNITFNTRSVFISFKKWCLFVFKLDFLIYQDNSNISKYGKSIGITSYNFDKTRFDYRVRVMMFNAIEWDSNLQR